MSGIILFWKIWLSFIFIFITILIFYSNSDFISKKFKTILQSLKPKALKSPKEKYEDILIERFKTGDWEFKKTREKGPDYLYIGGEPVLFFDPDMIWLYSSESTGKFEKLKNVIIDYQKTKHIELEKEYKKQEEEKRRNEEIQKQKEEDELYESKIKELLKIKPLDADLKEDFKRASRRIELSNNMLKRAEENKKDYEELLTIMPKKGIEKK